ncbi:uncharacterized protein LOC121405424 [Drosophila obscura]|uniref:uncharacterized protein LOC121405424 n=1 Tax=Drosophila obscura TaxID=7282 RepID=UPI001BB1D18E|nr:uncharacterized protein LOC121405424 [Drosophila obscura]
MYLHGSCYKLAKRLRSIGEHDISLLESQDKRKLIQERIRDTLHHAYERSSLRYNQRARVFYARPGQEVFRRNFVLSDFGKCFNTKFARKFIRCRVVKPVGENAYALEDLNGRPIGVYHAKDLRL